MTNCEFCLNYVWDEDYGERVCCVPWTRTKWATACSAAHGTARFFSWMMNTKSFKSRIEKGAFLGGRRFLYLKLNKYSYFT